MNANHEALRQEMQFRLDLLRLMTVPHSDAAHSDAASKAQEEAGEMEELAAAVLPKAA